MNAYILVCMVCYPKLQAAKRLVGVVKRELDIDLPLEAGYHGQCDLVVNGDVLPLTTYFFGRTRHTEMAQFVVNELRERRRPDLAAEAVSATQTVSATEATAPQRRSQPSVT